MHVPNSVAHKLAPEFYKRFESKCLNTPLIKKLDERIATLRTGIAYDQKEIKESQETLDRLNRYLTNIAYRSHEQISDTIKKRTDIRSWIEARRKHFSEFESQLHEVETTRKCELNFLTIDSVTVKKEMDILQKYQQVELPEKKDAIRKKIELEDHVATVIKLREQLVELHNEDDLLNDRIKLRQRYLKYVEKRTQSIEILQEENIIDLVRKGPVVELISSKVDTIKALLKINLRTGKNCHIRIATLGEKEIRCIEKALVYMNVYDLKLYAIAEQVSETPSEENVMQRLEIDLNTWPYWQKQADTVSITLKIDAGVVTQLF